jgi:kynurenine formamidase
MKNRLVRSNVFPFHNYGFQEGLTHAKNLGGDIELALNQHTIIGVFPWKYNKLEACPFRIVAFLDC